MTPPLEPFTMLVTLRIRPDRDEDFRRALHDVLGPARSEPACLDLRVHEAHDEPGTYYLLESWRDVTEYLGEILRKPYYCRYLEISEATYASPRTVVRLNPLFPSSGLGG